MPGLAFHATWVKSPSAAHLQAMSGHTVHDQINALKVMWMTSGKTFFKKKKQPIPVDLTKADWGAQIQRACQATYMYPASGSSLSIRFPIPCTLRSAPSQTDVRIPPTRRKPVSSSCIGLQVACWSIRKQVCGVSTPLARLEPPSQKRHAILAQGRQVIVQPAGLLAECCRCHPGHGSTCPKAVVRGPGTVLKDIGQRRATLVPDSCQRQ